MNDLLLSCFFLLLGLWLVSVDFLDDNKDFDINTLPIIDIAALFDDNNMEEQLKIAQQIHDACRNIGFFI